jgi:signal transduction histidine kinase
LTTLKKIFKENNDVRIILVAVVYFISAYIGILLAFHDTYTWPVWPPVGVGLAMIILLGPRTWPGIMIGSLISYMLVFWLTNINFGTGAIFSSTLISIGNTLEILAGYFLLRLYVNISDPFRKTGHTFIFLIMSLIMCLIGSSIGTYALYFNGFISRQQILTKWFFWWVPNVASMLMFTPFILSWTRGFKIKLTRNHIIEIVIFTLLISSFIILLNLQKLTTTVEKSTPFLVIPFLLWLAFRFNLQTAITGILITALSAIYLTTIIGTGPFVLDSNDNSIILLQIFIGVISITTIVLSSTVYERTEAQSTIRKFYDTIETKIKERTKALNDEISFRKKAEQKLKITNHRLRKANVELDNFVYRVSHDLRAPIASVLGLVHIARNEKNPENITKYFAMIEKSAVQQDRFIKDILDLSRNARLEIDNKKISFGQLIDETFEQLKYSDKEKNIEKKITLKDDIPFYSDPHRLQVILNNLISNSIRYSNGKKPLLEIDIDVNSENAAISVKDNGIGIDKTHHKKIFNMFYRATDNNAGSGLGLYIVKESMDKLKGTINLDSEPGKGTTVSLMIPNLQNGHNHLPGDKIIELDHEQETSAN